MHFAGADTGVIGDFFAAPHCSKIVRTKVRRPSSDGQFPIEMQGAAASLVAYRPDTAGHRPRPVPEGWGETVLEMNAVTSRSIHFSHQRRRHFSLGAVIRWARARTPQLRSVFGRSTCSLRYLRQRREPIKLRPRARARTRPEIGSKASPESEALHVCLRFASACSRCRVGSREDRNEPQAS